MKIDERGMVDDGSPNLEVSGYMCVGLGVLMGYEQVNNNTALADSGSVRITTPGMYTIDADGSSITNGFFTGTVPRPDEWPGSMLMIVDSHGGHPWCLTGSAWSSDLAVFSMQPGVSSSNNRNHGTHMKVSRGGSVAFLSDGYYWCVTAGSGSYQLFGRPVPGENP